MGFINARVLKPIEGRGGGGGKGGGGGGAGAVPHEDPNTLRSDSLARILDMVSEGPIEGLANGAASIFFDNTALTDAAGNYNFSGVTWDHREGLPDQDYMPGFSAAEDEVVENAEIVQATPITRTLSGPVDAARVTIQIPQLSFQDPSTGDLHGTSAEFKIWTRPNAGSWTQAQDITLNGKCVSPYESSYRVELGGSGDWDVKVERVTADSADVNLHNKTFWASVTLITDGKFQYINKAYIGFSVDAQQFGNSVPSRAFDVKGLLIQIPSNYDPIARTYTGNWDGTFQTAWSNNPAWVLYDVLTNARYGLGSFITPAQVDKWGLYTIAQYCDELVDDGFGGQEPRYTFNYQINSMDDAYKVVQAIASNFRGLTYWSSGLVKIVADMPADPVKLVSQANIKDGLFTYEGVAYSARHSLCLVTWYDPNNMCNPTIEMVEDAELIAKFGWRPTQLTAYGCTSRGQAHRMGKWALDTERYATQTVNYQAAWDHIDVVPGDIIEVYDPDYQAVRRAGRVVTSDSNSVTLDGTVALAAGKTYTLRLMMPDGTLASRTVNIASGTVSVLTFDTPLAQQPVVGAKWGLVSSDLAPRPFRVLSIKEDADGLFTVSAIFYDPTKYARVEQNLFLEPPVYSPYISLTVPTPINLTAVQYVFRANGVALPSVTFSWQAPPSTVPNGAYQLQYQPPDKNWSDVIDIRSPSFDIEGVIAGLWNFRVRCISFDGRTGAWATLAVNLNDNTSAPDDVTNFAISLAGLLALFTWDQSPAPDLDHYRMKFQPVTSGAVWESAVDLLPYITSTNTQAPAMAGTYLLKAVNVEGVESNGAATIVTTAASLVGIDTIATISDSPGWSGTKTDTTVSGGVLKLTTSGGLVTPSGTYQFAAPYDIGAVYSVRLTPQITAQGENISSVMASWPTLASVATLSGTTPTDWTVNLSIRTTPDDPAGSPTWSAWMPLLVGDYTCRAFEIKAELVSNNTNVNVDVTDISVIIGMKQRTETQKGLTTSNSADTAVTVSPSFYGTPGYVPAFHNMATGDYAAVTSKTSTGCIVNAYNSSGTRVVRAFDITVGGHGYGT